MIAFFFFLTLGLGYLISSLMALNGDFLPMSKTAKQTLFLPFIVMGIAYGTSSFLEGLASEGKNTRMQTMVAIGGALILITVVAYLHFGLPIASTSVS